MTAREEKKVVKIKHVPPSTSKVVVKKSKTPITDSQLSFLHGAITDILGANLYVMAWLFLGLFPVIILCAGVYQSLEGNAAVGVIVHVRMAITIIAICIVFGLFLRWLAEGIVNHGLFKTGLAALFSALLAVLMLRTNVHATNTSEINSHIYGSLLLINSLWLWYMLIKYGSLGIKDKIA